MNMHDLLKSVFDNTVKKDDAAAEKAFSDYIHSKAASVLNSLREQKSPFKLSGDDVLVNDKKVGTLKHDVDDDKGIEYTSVDGKKKKFKELKDLYAHLAKEHKVTESVKDYEKEVQGLDNHADCEDVDAFEDGEEESDGKAKAADKKRQKPIKKLIKDVDAGKRHTKA